MSQLCPLDREALIAIIRDVSLETTAQPILRVGRQFSNFNIHMQSTLNHPLAAKYIGRAMLALLEEVSQLGPVLRIGPIGPTGIAITTAMLIESGAPKAHGPKPQAFSLERGVVTGLPVNRGALRGSIRGKPVVLLEGLAANGKAGVRAAAAVHAAGGHLIAILAVVDRGNQATSVYKKHGIAFHALLHAPKDVVLPGFHPVTHWPKRHK